jgi:hypothetical protein
MHSFEAPSVAQLREVVVAELPEFERSRFAVLNEGWDSVALEADGAWIFKFPRHLAAEQRLRKECRILSMIRPRVAVPVPEMVLHEGTNLFSVHRKLSGRFLLGREYLLLDGWRRDAVAEKMAGLYAALHAIPHSEARAAGATAIEPWTPTDAVAKCAPRLPDDIRPFLQPTLDAFAALRSGPGETVYGYFDGHGWNMAFDHETSTLNGVYDFADSGFGARHQDLSYSNWIARDLTRRIIDRYERLTGHAIDRERVMLYSQMLRFVEFADTAPDAADLPARIAALREWFTADAA